MFSNPNSNANADFHMKLSIYTLFSTITFAFITGFIHFQYLFLLSNSAVKGFVPTVCLKRKGVDFRMMHYLNKTSKLLEVSTTRGSLEIIVH